MKLAGEKPTAKKDDPNRKVLTHPYSFEDGKLNVCSSVITLLYPIVRIGSLHVSVCHIHPKACLIDNLRTLGLTALELWQGG